MSSTNQMSNRQNHFPSSHNPWKRELLRIRNVYWNIVRHEIGCQADKLNFKHDILYFLTKLVTITIFTQHEFFLFSIAFYIFVVNSWNLPLAVDGPLPTVWWVVWRHWKFLHSRRVCMHRIAPKTLQPGCSAPGLSIQISLSGKSSEEKPAFWCVLYVAICICFAWQKNNKSFYHFTQQYVACMSNNLTLK